MVELVCERCGQMNLVVFVFSSYQTTGDPQANDLKYVDEASHHLDEQCTGFLLESKTYS